MPKFEITIDQNYRRAETEATDVRSLLRRTVHQPHKRATTRTLFLIGVATLVVALGSIYGAPR